MATTLINTALEPLYMHQSWMGSASLCAAKQDPKHLEHPDYDPTPSEAMSFGSLVHALIAQQIGLLGAGYDLNPPQPAAILNLWQRLAVERDGFILDRQAELGSLRKSALEARDALDAWYRAIWQPSLQHEDIIAHEVELEKLIGYLPSGRAVILRGTPDVVKTHALDDWKTSGRWFDQGKADTQIQGPTYAILAEHCYPKVAPIESMTYWVYNRSKGAWSPAVQTITKESKVALVATAMQFAAMREAGAYPPTPAANSGKNGRNWHCSPKYCNAWNVCDYKGLIPDGADLTAKRDRGWS